MKVDLPIACTVGTKRNSKGYKTSWNGYKLHRVNGRLKDEFGGRMVRVKGHAKVTAHLMFGIIALTVEQWMKFVE